MTPIVRPVTRDSARQHVADQVPGGQVVDVDHPGLAAVTSPGGFAFVAGRRLWVVGRDGSLMVTVDPGHPVGRAAAIDQRWDELRHDNRPLAVDQLGPWQRAAVAAVTAGVASVRDLPPAQRPGVVDDLDLRKADYLLVALEVDMTGTAGETRALRVLAGADWMLRVPDDTHVAHACPLCGRPAIGSVRYPRQVCRSCLRRTVCEDGRVVRGTNTHMSGGFEARHADDDSVCPGVTRTGRGWVGGQAVDMGEAHMGGTYVQAPPS